MRFKGKIILAGFLALLIFIALSEIFWLIPIVLVIAFIVLLYSFLSKIRFPGKRLLQTLIGVFGIVSVSITIRLFVFEVYAIPTPSMENTIIVGDKVLVNKLKHGPALPRSPFEIPWVNLFFYFNPAHAGTSDSLYWEYNRLKGYGDIERGDVVVFNHPRWDQVFIKRCVGIPGDTIEIREGRLFVNNHVFQESNTVRQPFRIHVNQPQRFREVLINDQVRGKWISELEFQANLTRAQVDEYSSFLIVDYVEPVIAEYMKDHELFPGKSLFHHSQWSIDNYGPFIVPFEGMTISLNAITDNHYWFLIRYREGNETGLRVKNDAFYLGDDRITEYTFHKDYYFFMGDNRHDSNDSRYWGPVQEDKLIGVATSILFSNAEEEFRWSRFFKPIR